MSSPAGGESSKRPASSRVLDDDVTSATKKPQRENSEEGEASSSEEGLESTERSEEDKHVKQLFDELYEAAQLELNVKYPEGIPKEVRANVRRECLRNAELQEDQNRQSRMAQKGEAGSDPSNGDASNGSNGDTSKGSDSTVNSSASKGNLVISQNDANWVESHNGASEPSSKEGTTEAPPLPSEAIPPLPSELPPGPTPEDDGWAPVWEETAQAFYFYNRFTGATQWDNPRVPSAPTALAPGVEPSVTARDEARVAGGYNPAIHGDYDPSAWYAQPIVPEEAPALATGVQDPYAQTGTFNRFTGRFQNPDLNPENFNDENKSKRQMNAYFDVDAAANSHDGRSLKEERSGKRISKKELKEFKEKRKQKKEEKRRAWLLD
jgi:hypothetical protein